MGTRIGAWLIDSLILGLLHGVFWVVVVAVGALKIDAEAQRQLEASPLTLPTVAPYQANLPLLAAMMTAFVALNVAYATFLWARLRGMPGQKLLSLQVGSSATGRNLSLGRALVRALVAVGIPMGAIAGVLYGALAFESSVPWPDVTNPKSGGPADAWLANWSGPLDLAILAALLWPALLLVWTIASPNRQGLHDRLAGSLVVGKGMARVPSFYGYYQGAVPPGAWPPGAVPPGAVPPGAWPPGAVPPGAVPPDAWPPGPPVADQRLPGSGDVTPGPSLMPPGRPGPEAQAPPGAGDRQGPEGWPVPGWIQPGQSPDPERKSAWLPPESRAGVRARLGGGTMNWRIAAYAFDCVFLYALYVLSASVAVAAFLPSSASASLDDRTLIMLGLMGGIEQLVYFVSGWVWRRGTIGQRFFHLRVTDAATGKALSPMDSVVRWAVLQGPFALASIVPGPLQEVVVVAAAGWLVYLFLTTLLDPDQRGLHDRFLNSRVRQDV